MALPKSIRGSTSLELDENNLFSFDQLPGYDIVEGGPRFNAGLRADAIFPVAHIEALVGESFRLKPDPIFAPDSGLSGTQSDIIGRFSVKFPPYIDLTHRIEADPSDAGLVGEQLRPEGPAFVATSLPPRTVKLIMPPKSRIWARATSCPGCPARPG